jgi:gliding motility-associated-like protein
MIQLNYIKFSLFLVAFLCTMGLANAQITSPDADEFTETNYPVGLEDSVYIFCVVDEYAQKGSLTANSPTGENSTFSWELYDTISGSFQSFNAIVDSDTQNSTIRNLGNGLYRVTVNGGGVVTTFRAWVFNNWIKITQAEIPDSSSTCAGFQIWAAYEKASLYYYNTETNERFDLRDSELEDNLLWYNGEEVVSSDLSPYVTPPIASNSPVEYKLVITDEFKCTGEKTVDYESKVPKADFTASPMEGEAVLKVTFDNNSINYDSVYWFFYKADSIIKLEVDNNPQEIVDSVDFVLLDDAPVYEYEHTGEYQVRLVTVHINETTGNCYDTLYMGKGVFINVLASFVDLPNVFTPNADGSNDVYIVRTKSLKSLTIKIYNRWGGLVHSWSYSNIRSSDYTIEHSVWDGKIGERMASPGVYYIVARGVGRDDKKYSKTGFIHLFRQRD